MHVKRPWDTFAEEKIRQIFSDKKRVIDIGGGLRVDREKNNRLNEDRAKWLLPLIKNVEYLILDKVPDYKPDIVGDVHNLPFPDASEEAIVCIAVLEHVENPMQAMDEIYRTLKPGGYAFIYVPFLYYYHAYPGYYGDYWRFTKDTLELFGRRFSTCEIASVRGAIETWIKLSPLGRVNFFCYIGYIIDRITGKIRSAQTSGYNVFLIK